MKALLPVKVPFQHMIRIKIVKIEKRCRIGVKIVKKCEKSPLDCPETACLNQNTEGPIFFYQTLF